MRQARTAQLITAPTTSVLNIAEIRDHVRIDHTDEDVLLYALMEACTEIVESHTWRKFRTSVWEVNHDYFPCTIELPFGGVSAVDSITYVDDNGVSQTLATSEYQTDLNRDVARIRPAYDKDWPSTRKQLNAVTVRFTCGSDVVPHAVRHAVLLLIGHFYENREASMVGVSVSELPLAVDSLLAPHTVATI